MNKATEHGPYAYNYDSLYRLAGAVSPVLPQESFSYDPVGNRLTSSTANNWSYNQNNELQSYNGVSFQYDLNGNTTQKNDNGTIQNFLYNEDDRLTEVKDGNGAVVGTYYYDPFGRRLWKEVGGARTYFMYADEGLIAEFDGTGSQTKSYGYAPNSTWTTNPLFMKQGGQYYFYHNDHLGTPQKMTSVSGAIAWSAKYESFGKTVVDSVSTILNNLRFPGQYYDNETGLHYNYHRYYDPNTGRYLCTDIIGLGLQNNGLYDFVRNSPINLTDSLGLFTEIQITSQKVAIIPGFYKSPHEAGDLYQAIDDVALLLKVAKVVQAGLKDGALSAMLKELENEITPGTGDIMQTYTKVMEYSLGNNAFGWTIYTEITYEECEEQDCFFGLFTKRKCNNKTTGWVECKRGPFLFGKHRYQSYLSAANDAQLCMQDHLKAFIKTMTK